MPLQLLLGEPVAAIVFVGLVVLLLLEDPVLDVVFVRDVVLLLLGLRYDTVTHW